MSDDKAKICLDSDLIEVNRRIHGVKTRDSDSDLTLVSKGWVEEFVKKTLNTVPPEDRIIAVPIPDREEEVINILPTEKIVESNDDYTFFVDSAKTFIEAIDLIKIEGRSHSETYTIKLLRNIDLTRKSELVIQNLKSTVIDGQGYKFHRTKDQTKYRMMNIVGANDLKFVDVGFDDGDDGIVGTTGSTPQMILIQRSANVVMDNVHVQNSKGYAMYVRETRVFKFINSEMEKSGILGLYVGHGSNQSSTGVVIDNNFFHDNSTNAVALQGVTGEIKNYVTNNRFERNHKYGRWPVAAKYGTGMTGGGQLYLAHVDNLLVTKNTISQGECINCIDKSNKQVKNVTGIELSGLYGADIRVKNVTITDNDVFGNDGKGIAQNLNSTLDDSTKVYDNRVRNNGKDYGLLSIQAT